MLCEFCKPCNSILYDRLCINVSISNSNNIASDTARNAESDAASDDGPSRATYSFADAGANSNSFICCSTACVSSPR